MLRAAVAALPLLTGSAPHEGGSLPQQPETSQQSSSLTTPNFHQAVDGRISHDMALELEQLLRASETSGALSHTPVMLSAEEIKAADPAVLTARAVRAFTAAPNCTAELTTNLRDGLKQAISGSQDPYLRSIANTYLLLPTRTVISSFTLAPDAEAVIALKNSGEPIKPIAGCYYPEATLKLMAQLDEQLRQIPDRGELDRRAEALAEVKLSPFVLELFNLEAEGLSPELRQRAELEMKQIVHGVREAVRKLREESGPRLEVVTVLDTIHRYLQEEYGVVEAVQGSLLEGLATHTFDCDIYTLVFHEVGRAIDLPVRMLMIVDDRENGTFGHCMPAVALGNRMVVYEPRSPIEELPGEKPRRVYREPAEIAARINRLAGQELIGPEDRPFLISPANYLAFRRAQRNAAPSAAAGAKD